MVNRIKKVLKKILGIQDETIQHSKFMADNPSYKKHSVGIGSYGYPKIYEWTEYSDTKLFVGKYCSFAANISILLGGEHFTDWVTTYPFSTLSENIVDMHLDGRSKGNVIIGNDVWIGNNAIILSGVTIGNGAIIGAGSVITKDVPCYAIYAGNPAKFIRYRIDEAYIKAMNKIEWWNWSAQKIEENRHLILSNSIEEFIKVHSK
jgi:acetyltransferase-like isoleucine patch superfamily enzyme